MKVCPFCGAMITKTYTNGKVPLHCGRADCVRKYKQARWRKIKVNMFRRDPAYTKDEVVRDLVEYSLTALLYKSGWHEVYEELVAGA